MQEDFDEQMMRRAIELARNATGRTSPNPLVGAVVVKEGRIVAEGWHRQAGSSTPVTTSTPASWIWLVSWPGGLQCMCR